MSKKVLVMGGNGALGKSVISLFKNTKSANFQVFNLDFTYNPLAYQNIILDKDFMYNDDILKEITEKLGDNDFDSMINVAGGWEGVALDSLDLFKSMKSMNAMNFYSTLMLAHLAKAFLNDNSLLAFTGAAAVRQKVDTTFCLTYQLAKNSVENLTDTLIRHPCLLPTNTKLVNICPGVIDTEMNRKYMPGNQTNWTDPQKIADLLVKWTINPSSTPKEVYYYV